MRILSLHDIESERLLRVKSGRTRGEYCWTLTPFTFDAVFNADAAVERVTYVDADVWLLRDPTPAFQSFEFSGAAVQITEHAYAPDHDQTETSGRYCVQFLTMVRAESEPVRRWWQERCIEWCFARFEDLVHVADPKSWFQGPWNATRFPYSEAVTYHFHGLRFVGPSAVHPFAGYRIPKPHWRYVYEPYLQDLTAAVSQIAAVTGTALITQQNTQKLLRKRSIDSALRRVIRRTIKYALRLNASADIVKLPARTKRGSDDSTFD